MNKYLLSLSLCVWLLMTSCTSSSRVGVSTSESGSAGLVEKSPRVTNSPVDGQTLIVYAAASLTGAFQEIGSRFEDDHPGVRVNLNIGGSQILRTQLEQGAQADVFASADYKNMDVLVADHLVAATAIKNFATNSLVVILPAGNPGHVSSLADLAKPGIKLVMADASVPAGGYALQALEKMSQDPLFGADFVARVLANLVSNETDVKQVVAKVELGEADAGIVYTTDAVATPKLGTISIPVNFNITASYPIAPLSEAPVPALAAEFINFVISSSGQAILVKWGFNPVVP